MKTLQLTLALIFIVLVASLLAPTATPEVRAAHRPQVKLMLLPFKMHAREDVSAARRAVMEVLASSLARQGADVVGIEEMKERVFAGRTESFAEPEALDLARSVKADFAVVGSLTRLDKFYNVDWRIIDLRELSAVAFYSRTAASEAELADRVRGAAPEMFAHMTGALKTRPAEKTGVIDRLVVTGNRRIDTEAITKKLKSAEGEPFSPDDVRDDIRTLFGMGYFDGITVDLADTASGKVLTFVVKELPFVRKIEFAGNKEVKKDTLSTLITMKEGTVLDRAVIADNVEKIKTVYSDEGFYLATVEPVVTTDGLDATVTFKIEENEEVRVKRITFIGNRFFSSRKLKGFIGTKEKGLLSVFTQSGKFDEFQFQNDIAILMTKYFDNGFIKAEILDHRVLLSEDKRYFNITLALAEGEQFRIGKLDVTGDILTSRDDILDKLGLASGKIFNRSKLGRGIEAVSEVYGNEGYAYAEVRPRTKIDDDNRIIDITLDIKKNDLVYVERIDLTGNIRTRDKVIRRELELEETKLFSTTAFKKSRNNLRRLGYFEEVKLTQTKGSAPDKMALNVDITERPTGSFSVGIGFSSVDKFIGTAAVSQTNFMGTGIKLDLSGTVSASSNRYILSITEPWLFDKPISAGFDLFNTGKEFPDFEIRKNGGAVRFGFPLQKRYTRMQLTYKLEDVKIFNVESGASTFIRDQEGQATESSIKALVRHDTRNDAFFPTSGEVLTGSVEFAGGFLGGSSYFIKYEGDAVKYFPLPLDTTVSFRGALGYVQGYEGHVVPIQERFFLGGINSLRGFETRSVGPKDPGTGDFIGGNSMMRASAEFVFPLVTQQNMRGVVFFDAGNAYKGRIDFTDIRRAAGFGLRWFSPIGPLRLELGFNLDRRDGEKAQQWEFSIGSMF